jgi:hypothetical protein
MLNMQNDSKTAELIAYLAEQVKTVGDFTAEQAPLVAREIVAWQLWSNVAAAGLCFVMVIAMLQSTRYAMNLTKVLKDEFDRTVVQVAALAFGLILSVALLACAFDASFSAFKAMTAPRVVILEYLTNR